MKSTLELLNEEIKKSNEYSRNNFGMPIGDGYTEMVKEVLKSDELSVLLMLHVAMIAISAKKMGEDMKEAKGPEGVGTMVLRNHEAFKEPFSMLYWGIQIGRKLQEQESKVLNELEKGL